MTASLYEWAGTSTVKLVFKTIKLLLAHDHCFENRHKRNNRGWGRRGVPVKVEKEICETEIRAWTRRREEKRKTINKVINKKKENDVNSFNNFTVAFLGRSGGTWEWGGCYRANIRAPWVNKRSARFCCNSVVVPVIIIRDIRGSINLVSHHKHLWASD